jgi:hypothetical protein
VKGLKQARVIWTIAFLGLTLAAIVMECVAGLWHPTGWTIPWTDYIAQYVPWPVQLAAYVALAVWLPFHFWRHDHMRKAAYREGLVAADMEKHPSPVELARRFHNAYEDLAPFYGHKAREAGALPWDGVPDQNRRLMIATAAQVLKSLNHSPWPDGR